MLQITAAAAADRLDRFLANALDGRSRSEIQRWIDEGRVAANGRQARASQAVKCGDVIEVELPEVQPASTEAEAIPLVVLYEDDDLVVIDKPAGMVVHPAPGHERGTVVNAILHHCPDLVGVGGVQRPGIVHRLDKDTSGILLVAKNDRSHRFLQAQFKARTVHKTYLALVYGQMQPPQGRIDAPIGRHPHYRQRMAVLSADQGRAAITEYEVLRSFSQACLVAAHPLTGRTHQIRVHFAAVGHPVVGDAVYGPRRDPMLLGRHFLHAHRLLFQRPADGTALDLISPLPPELEALLAQLAARG